MFGTRRHNHNTLNYLAVGLEESSNRIINKYSTEMSLLRDKAFNILEETCQRYMSKQKITNIQNQQAQSVSTLPTYNIALLSKKKIKKNKTYETDEQQSQQNAQTIIQSIKKIPNKKNLIVPQFNSNQRKSQFCIGTKQDATTDKLIYSLKKLSMSHDRAFHDDLYDQQNQSEKENTINGFNTEEIDNQNFDVLNQNSLKKLKQLQNKANQLDPIQSAQSQGYIMTDYSSNQSSNDNSYDIEQRQESRKSLLLLEGDTVNEPLFGGMFSYPSLQNKISCKTVSEIPNKITFDPQQFMYSPKKSPKAKRIYIRNKKIPRWAQNFEQVKKQVLLQKKTIPNPVKDIYGKFVVENLNSNIIFNSSDNYIRTSSAKWNHDKFIV